MMTFLVALGCIIIGAAILIVLELAVFAVFVRNLETMAKEVVEYYLDRKKQIVKELEEEYGEGNKRAGFKHQN
jgi:hypothetical protein